MVKQPYNRDRTLMNSDVSPGKSRYNYTNEMRDKSKKDSRYLNSSSPLKNSYYPGSAAASEKKSFDEAAVLERIRDKYSNVKQTKLLSKETSEELIKGYLEGSSYRDDGPRYVNGKPWYRHPAPFGNYVEGKMNYNYQGHSPRQIKLAKYLRRFREARGDPEPPSQHLKSTSSMSREKLVSKKKSSLHSEHQDNIHESLFNYNYQSKTPGSIKLDKYINRYRVAVAPNYGDFKTYTSKLNEKSSKHVPKTLRKSSSSSSLPGSSKTTTCPICNLRIDLKDYDTHLGSCFGDDVDFDDDDFVQESPVSSPSKDSTREKLDNYCDDSMATANCSNCGSEVLLAEMKLHLQYCVDSDEETDLDESPRKSAPHSPEKKQNASQHTFLRANLVPCPSCMEKVKEEDIQQHLDVCLSFFSEEF